MSDWNSEQYLKFKDQRTRPAIDLAAHLRDLSPKTIVDIGCGPGNSTILLKNMFPDADLCGIDNSENMIEKAKATYPDIEFKLCSAEELTGTYDLLFSNACLHWIPDHKSLIPALMEHLNPGGVLAVQIPMNANEPMFRIIREAAAESEHDFSNVYYEKYPALNTDEYFDLFSSCTSAFNMWETVYYHEMPDHQSMLDWVKSARLRPYLDDLTTIEAAEFEKELLARAEKEYHFHPNGKLIFRFNRFFFVAVK